MKTIIGSLIIIFMTGCAGGNDNADSKLTNSNLYVSYHRKNLVFKRFSQGNESKINTTDNFVVDAAVVHFDENGNEEFSCMTNVQAQSVNGSEDEYLLTFSYSIVQSDECTAFEKTYKIKMGTESRAELSDY